MKKTRRSDKITLILLGTASAILLIIIIVVSFLSLQIKKNLQDSAFDYLMSSAEIIRRSADDAVGEDLDMLELYAAQIDNFDSEQLQSSMKIFNGICGHIVTYYADLCGQGFSSSGEYFSTDMLIVKETALSTGKASFSNSYTDEAGRNQIVLQAPVIRDNQIVGAFYSCVVTQKYYTDENFAFRDGAGRAFIINSDDGAWVVKGPVSGLIPAGTFDMYEALTVAGNDEILLAKIQEAVREKKREIFCIKTGSSQRVGYMAVTPSLRHSNWCLAAVIPSENLQGQAQTVTLMLRIIQGAVFGGIVLVLIVILYYNRERQRRHLDEMRKKVEHESRAREKRLSEITMREYDFQIIVDLETMDCRQEVYAKQGWQWDTTFKGDFGQSFRAFCQKCVASEDVPILTAFCGPDCLRDMNTQGEVSNKAVQIKTFQDNVAVWYECSLSLGEAEGHNCVFLLNKNVTESFFARKQLEQMNEELAQRLEELQTTQGALQVALEQAKSANKAKSLFLANMSHDIRTPMNAVMGMTQIAVQNVKNPEKVRECLNMIRVSSEHLLGLINDILDMSKIESGKMVLAEADFTLSEVIQRILTIIYPLCIKKGQHFYVELGNIQHEAFCGDMLRLNQVLINLLNNANKFTPEGGEICLGISELPVEDELMTAYCFEVSDNGIGIEPKYQANLFQAFDRGATSATNQVEGTGLGLAIAMSIVKAMSGTLKVESEPGHGRKFTAVVYFSLSSTAIENDMLDIPEEYQALVVDENSKNMNRIVNLLEKTGITSEGVLSGNQAIEKAASKNYNIVLLSDSLKDMSFTETVQRIRDIPGMDQAVFWILTYDWTQIQDAAIKAGAAGFLSKPVFQGTLRQKLREYLNVGAAIIDQQAESMIGRTFLIVEDNAINAMIACTFLESQGAMTEIASNGKEAVEIFEHSEPAYFSAIFMDVQMPVMNGYEATEQIRLLSHPQAKTIPIIAMTANAFSEDIQAAYKSGMNSYLSKPIDLDLIIETLRKLNII